MQHAARSWIIRSAALAAVFCAAASQAGNLTEIYRGNFTHGRTTSSSALRIVDWNIHKGRHLEEVVRALQAQEPDLVLLQEVDYDAERTGRRDIAGEIARRLGLDYVFAPAFRELGQGRGALHGQAILARAKIAAVRTLRYRQQSQFWQPHSYLPNWGLMQRRLGGRIALVTEIDTPVRKIAVYNLHLESRGFGHTRDIQLDETLADARRYPPSAPVIIAGDLNTLYGSKAVRARLESEGFHDCFGGTPVRTHVIVGALDYIYVRGPLRCEGSQVVRGTGGSDHDPVTAKIRLIR